MMVAANRNGAAQENLVAAHLSQWKPKRNQASINRFVPGETIFLEPTRAGDEQLFARSEHSSKIYQIQRLKPSHFCLLSHTLVRVRFGLDSARQEEEQQVAERRPENHGRDRESEEADGQTIAGATGGARGSDGFRASGMVHRSPSTCAGSTNPTAYSSQPPAPVQRFDGASDGGVLPPNGAVRYERTRRFGVATARFRFRFASACGAARGSHL